MTVIQKNIGRLPVNLGDYDSTRAYGKKNRVLLYGCEWESKVDNNTYAPATLNTTTGVITTDTTHWKLISGSYNTWLIDNGYQKLDASNVKDGNDTQHAINENFAGQLATVDERIAAEGAQHYLKSETYTKEEVNGLVTTPNQEFVTVEATGQTTAATDVLPATGAADTIYRVANWDGSQYDASVYSEYAWNGTQYIHLSTKTQIGEVFDISAYHATGGTLATYTDLADALTGTNGGVPQSLQKGGMSIKFVQSSDNKYVQFRCIADEFTTDITQWAIAEEGVYVENPEFVYVKTDNEGKILWAIKFDGSIYYGAGCPQQVKDYIEEKLAELSLDEYEDIVAFLNGLEEGDKTLQTLLNEKVDKEEGKSLIDTEYASSQSAIDNPEFLEVTTDSEDKILEGIKSDGTSYIGGDLQIEGDTKVRGNVNLVNGSIQSVDNPKYLKVTTDVQGKVLDGIKKDGSHYIHNVQSESIDAINENKVDKEEGKGLSTNDYTDADKELVAVHEIVDNPEYIKAEVDSESKLLAGRTPNGAAFENVGFSTPKISIDGQTIENIKDPEGRSEITTDSDEKVISYRDSSGVKHEEVGIETGHIGLTEDGMTEFQKALINSGFNPKSVVDWSDESFVQIPIPRTLARVNLITDTIPTTKEESLTATLEYWDMDGNYFRKPIKKFACQGNSSMSYAIKNFKFDLADGSEIKFGHWVAQDSFHLKAFYIDVFVGMSNIVYNYVEDIYKHLGCRPSRNAFDHSNVDILSASGETKEDFDTGALCHPEGFPVELYVNGEYYALYALNLKKHRANYLMDKKDYTTIHIDGNPRNAHLFEGSENLDWRYMEFKNPKTLICMDGTKYDDENPKELIDDTSEFWDAKNKDMKNTQKTKNVIKAFSDKWQHVQDLYDAHQRAEAKEYLATFYDIDAAVMFWVISDVVFNYDGLISGNTQWEIYRNYMMAPTFYDCDSCFGRFGYGTFVDRGITVDWFRPHTLLASLYGDEIKALYKNLRDSNHISVKHIMSFVYDYIERIGYEALKRNIDMRNEKGFYIPSYRDSFLNKDYWKQDEHALFGNADVYDETRTYNVGDKCKASSDSGSPIVECIQQCVGQSPLTDRYVMPPYIFGYYDSPERIEKWLTTRISDLDTKYQYLAN